MTTLTLRTSPAPAGRLAAVARLVANVVAGVREGREIAERYDDLTRLSDRALAARGLAREDIPQAAVAGVRAF